MARDCIYNIDLITSNDDRISVSSDFFNHFYIANIDEFGNEDNYELVDDSGKLKANFFMIKILSSFTKKKLDLIKKNHNIIGISINFTNGNIQEFDVAKKRILSGGVLENIYQDDFYIDDDLCILICDKKIKYKENLFA